MHIYIYIYIYIYRASPPAASPPCRILEARGSSTGLGDQKSFQVAGRVGSGRLSVGGSWRLRPLRHRALDRGARQPTNREPMNQKTRKATSQRTNKPTNQHQNEHLGPSWTSLGPKCGQVLMVLLIRMLMMTTMMVMTVMMMVMTDADDDGDMIFILFSYYSYDFHIIHIISQKKAD